MQGHFYGHLDFDLDKTIYMFSGMTHANCTKSL